MKGISFCEKYEYSKYPTILTDYTIDASLRNNRGSDKATNNNNSNDNNNNNNNNNVVKYCEWLNIPNNRAARATT